MAHMKETKLLNNMTMHMSMIDPAWGSVCNDRA